MRLLMLSGDRDTVTGERGPFYYLHEIFSKFWERIDVLCPRPARPVKLDSIHGNVFFHPSPAGRMGLTRDHVRRGRELMRQYGHDVLVSHDYGIFSNGRAAGRLAREADKPWMSEIFHVPGIPRAANLRERLDPWICRAYVKWALRQGVDAFRVMNRRELPPFLRRCGVAEDKIRFLSALYMDLGTFAPKPGAAKEYDLCFVARMVPNKGADVVMDAIARILPSRSEFRACFVGKGPLRPSLEARARNLGLTERIRFVDWLATKEDLADLYRASRVLVCASYNEGGPRVTCEAMACGTPVVSTPIGVMPDLVRDGENGWLYDFDARSLAVKLEAALGDPDRYARVAAASRAAVLPFERSATIGLYAEGLQRLVKDRGR